MRPTGLIHYRRQRVLLALGAICLAVALLLKQFQPTALPLPLQAPVWALFMATGLFAARGLREFGLAMLRPAPEPWFARPGGMLCLVALLIALDGLFLFVDRTCITPICGGGSLRQALRLLAATGATLVWIPLLDWLRAKPSFTEPYVSMSLRPDSYETNLPDKPACAPFDRDPADGLWHPNPTPLEPKTGGNRAPHNPWSD